MQLECAPLSTELLRFSPRRQAQFACPHLESLTASSPSPPMFRPTQVHWRQIGLLAGAAAVVRDLYAEKNLGTFTNSFSAAVTAHDVVRC